MTIRLLDNQGRHWTVEGDWSAQVVGADFAGRGTMLIRLAPDSADAELQPARRETAEQHMARLLSSGKPPKPAALPAGEDEVIDAVVVDD